MSQTARAPIPPRVCPRATLGSRIRRLQTLGRRLSPLGIGLSLQAAAQTFRLAPGLPPMQVVRNWSTELLGGRFGLLELTSDAVWTHPPKFTRTSLFVGPWHWTFDASAPQVLTVMIVITITTAFVTGWIRTHRYGR